MNLALNKRMERRDKGDVMRQKKSRLTTCQICRELKPNTSECVDLPNRRIICKECKAASHLKVFRVSCSWQVDSHFEIPARDLNEAISIANDPSTPLPTDSDYVPSTFSVDEDACEEMEGEEI